MLARGPETAAQVRQAFEKHRGGEAHDLYRMLWGYTPEELKNGEAAKLVEALNSDSLDFRVLGFYNLQTITGKTLFYQPQQPAVKRRPNYLKWKERLREGKIVFAEPVPAKPATTAPAPRAAKGPVIEEKE